MTWGVASWGQEFGHGDLRMSSTKRDRDAIKISQSERERGGPHLVGFCAMVATQPTSCLRKIACGKDEAIDIAAASEPNDVRRPQLPAGSVLSAQGPSPGERPLLSEGHTPNGARESACREAENERVRQSGGTVERFDEVSSGRGHRRRHRREARQAARRRLGSAPERALRDARRMVARRMGGPPGCPRGHAREDDAGVRCRADTLADARTPRG